MGHGRGGGVVVVRRRAAISAQLPGRAFGSRVGGWARLDTTGGPQPPASPPSSCLCSSFLDMLVSHGPSQKLSQGWGQAVAGVAQAWLSHRPAAVSPFPAGWGLPLLAFRGLEGTLVMSSNLRALGPALIPRVLGVL